MWSLRLKQWQVETWWWVFIAVMVGWVVSCDVWCWWWVDVSLLIHCGSLSICLSILGPQLFLSHISSFWVVFPCFSTLVSFISLIHSTLSLHPSPSSSPSPPLLSLLPLPAPPPLPSLHITHKAIVKEDQLLSRLEMMENQLQLYTQVGMRAWMNASWQPLRVSHRTHGRLRE